MNPVHSFAVGLLAIATLSGAASAARPAALGAKTRLHRCGMATCLLVTGHRPDAAAPVRLAGHDVTVAGGRAWRASVPLDTVQAWSVPFARTIAVQVGGPESEAMQARLPTGLLGHITDLAFLDVHAAR